METFAQRVRRLREAQGIPVRDLAIAVGVSPGAIRQLETGRVKAPSFMLGLRLAKHLHVDPDYLALGEGHSTTDHLVRIDGRLDKLERRLAQFPARR